MIFRRLWGILAFYLLTLGLLSCLILIWTFGIRSTDEDFGDSYKDSEEYYSYKFSNVYTIFVTLLFMMTTNNTPDMALGDKGRGAYLKTIYYSVTLFNLLLNTGIILAIVNQKYHQIFEEEVQEFKNLTEYQTKMIE